MGPRARGNFGTSMFEPEVFRKQMYSIEENTCDIVGTFLRPTQESGAPAVIWRPGNCAHLPPSLRPCTLANNLQASDKNVLSVPTFFRSKTEFFLMAEKN